MSRNLKMLLLSFVLALTSCNADSRIAKDREELEKLVVKFSPKAKIIKEADIDTTSCGYVSNPGIVIADFNGDKKIDYAALLQMGEPVDTVYVLGQDTIPYKNARLTFVIFLAENDGKFRTVTMNDYVEFAHFPIDLVIQIQPAGAVKKHFVHTPWEVKEIHINTPGISLTYCKGSIVALYWNKQKEKFDEFWVDD